MDSELISTTTTTTTNTTTKKLIRIASERASEKLILRHLTWTCGIPSVRPRTSSPTFARNSKEIYSEIRKTT